MKKVLTCAADRSILATRVYPRQSFGTNNIEFCTRRHFNCDGIRAKRALSLLDTGPAERPTARRNFVAHWYPFVPTVGVIGEETMDIRQILAELREQREYLDEALIRLEILAQRRTPKRGRPPSWLRRIATADPKKTGWPEGLNKWTPPSSFCFVRRLIPALIGCFIFQIQQRCCAKDLSHRHKCFVPV